jgi:hypothetical protein
VDKSSNSVVESVELQKFFGCAYREVRLTGRARSVFEERCVCQRARARRVIDERVMVLHATAKSLRAAMHRIDT